MQGIPISFKSAFLMLLLVVAVGTLIYTELASLERLKTLDEKFIIAINGLNKGKKLISNDVAADYQFRLRVKEIEHQLKRQNEETRRRFIRTVATVISLVVASVAMIIRYGP